MQPNKRNKDFIKDENAHNKKSKKKSKKHDRANHKHQYEEIVLDCVDFRKFGKCMAKRCTICGRIGDIELFTDTVKIEKAINKGVPIYTIQDFWQKYI